MMLRIENVMLVEVGRVLTGALVLVFTIIG